MSPTRFLSPSLALLALLAGGCHPDPQRISPPEDPDDGPPGPAKTLQHCLEEERHPGEDEVIKRVESSYDDAGRLTRKTTDGYYADGQPDVIVVYAYDDEGRLASETTKWTDRTHQEERRYLYSADGRLDAIETWAVDEDDDELRSVEVHEYEAGRLRRRVVAGPDRIADEDPVRWDYEYRPDGSLARMVYQWPPPSEAALISEYDGAGQQVLMWHDWARDDELDQRFDYLYDDDGRLEQATRLDLDEVGAEPESMEEYRYDSRGRLVEKQWRGWYEQGFLVTTYSYGCWE